jgi:DNA-binding transcriptional ArsR family regulator
MRKCETRERILALLARRMTVMELVEEVECTERTIRHHLKVLREAEAIHIISWKKQIGTGGLDAAQFIAGQGKDRKRPGREPRTLTQARHYAKYAAKKRLGRQPDYAKNNPFAALMQGML